jgi:hypothetical protein
VKVILIIFLSLLVAGMPALRSQPSAAAVAPETAACAAQHCQCGCCVEDADADAPEAPAAPAPGGTGQELQPILAAREIALPLLRPSPRPIVYPAPALSAGVAPPLYVRDCAPLV